ncbi:MAG: anaerobic ribonucleoside triphosphate reductase, partial [Kiritimatiellae bacterium]|nr:anaerobic ribonucleoside triphosphate reductase [Kiritimatiellia bacterium]
MIKTVIKRDGRQVPFNLAKIATAILKALAQTRTSEQLADKDDFELEALANKLAEEATRKVTIEAPDIEQIQDAVERVLMDHNFPNTAKSYILYRADRSRARERNTKLMRTLSDIVYSSAKDSDVKRENANIDGDTAMGSMLKFGSESSKQFYIDNMLRPEVARAHEQGDIHIHDLDFYSLTMTCCQIDLVDLLGRGFSTGHGFLRPPRDIRSFAALACIAIQSNQNDQHGGQS